MRKVASAGMLWLAAGGVMMATSLTSVHAQSAFTIAVLPDTQFYSESTLPAGANFFDIQANWVVNNAASRNIVFVTHLGDIVDDAGPVGTPFLDQWDDAVRAMNIIKAGGVRHGILPGNHDWTNPGGSGSLEHYRARFGDGSSFYAGQPWFLGYDPRGGSSAQLIQTPIGTMLNLSLEWNFANPAVSSDRPGAPANGIAWAQSIINQYPNVPTIISTHNNVNGSSVRDAAGLALFNNLVKNNNQVFLVLNGHYCGEGRVDSTNDFGRPVYELLADYQCRARGGDAWLRLMEFDAPGNVIRVRTYTPLSDAALGTPAGAEFGNVGRVETDANSQFDLPLDFGTRFVPPPPPPPPPAQPQAAAPYTLKHNLNGYTGAVDTEIRTSNPAANLGAQQYLHVDTDDTAGGGTAGPSHGLVRFENLFGSGANQLADEKDVLNARLRLYMHENRDFADGSGFEVRRMLADWTEASTWNSLNAGIAANGSNGAEAYANPDGFIGANNSSANVPRGQWIEFDVTRTLRAWRNGQLNRGWLLQAFASASNAIRVETKESTLAGGRFPELVITPTQEPVTTTSFTQGVDTYIDQSQPNVIFNTANSVIMDASVENNANAALSDSQGLIRFTDVFGTQAGQVPPGALVSSATLVLHVNANTQFSDGGGFTVHRLLRDWQPTDSWNTLNGGIATNDFEAALQPDDAIGLNIQSQVNVRAGLYYVDVTDSVRRWSEAGGEVANKGWALVPFPLATDAVFIDSFDSTVAGNIKPRLVVRYVPVACPADIGTEGGAEGADSLLDNNDFIVFINWFFSSDARADIASEGGEAVADGLFDNNDFIVFINRFFAGC
jgi:hypothetical protein